MKLGRLVPLRWEDQQLSLKRLRRVAPRQPEDREDVLIRAALDAYSCMGEAKILKESLGELRGDDARRPLRQMKAQI